VGGAVVTYVHVAPIRDLIEHDTDGFDECVCGPDVRFVEGGAVVTHHSLDGRERFEGGETEAGVALFHRIFGRPVEGHQ
jgi:hypothetical protein